MKKLVDIVQLLLIMLVLSPVYFVWHADQVNDFCATVKTGMHLKPIFEHAEKDNMKILGLSHANLEYGKWQASIVSKAPFTSGECRVKGLGDTIAMASYID
jgi:hypothetical protein